MQIEEAVKKLWEESKHEPWFQSIGLDSPANTKIFLYLKSKNGFKQIKGIPSYEGYPLVIQYMGEITPL